MSGYGGKTSGVSIARIICTVLALALVIGQAGAVTVTQQANRLHVDGKPTPLTFARGCTDPADLPAYRALGFNTVLVTVNSLGTSAQAATDALVTAAEQEGLYILVEFVAGAWMGNRYANPNDAEYLSNAEYYLNSVIPRFRNRANLVGWMISTTDEDLSIVTLSTFVRYLQQKYGPIHNLVEAWTVRVVEGERTRVYAPKLTTYGIFDTLSVEQISQTFAQHHKVREKMAEDYAEYLLLKNSRDSALQRYLQSRYPDIVELRHAWQCNDEWSFHTWEEITVDAVTNREKRRRGSSPASQLELARFRSLVSSTLLEWWAQQVASRDPSRLLFAGAQHRYRTLATLSSSINGVVTECYPGFAEADLETQNPHAIDIARHGNRKVVLAGLLAQGVTPTQLANALYTAALHGAAGVCVTDWATIKATLAYPDIFTHARAVAVALADFYQRGLLNRTPAPTVALVYSPFAPGPQNMRDNLYGYMDNFLYAGPGAIFFGFRNGTCLGQFDYLSADDLTQLPLARYHAIVLPSVVDLPEASQQALLQYVKNGGRVLADIGVGTLQTQHKNLYFLPDTMMQLFNVQSVLGYDRARYNLEFLHNENFVGLLPGLRTNGLMKGYMIDRTAKVIPKGGAQLLFSMVKSTKPGKPTVKKREPLPLKAVRGVTIYEHGIGYAIYAPFTLYEFWHPGHRLFNEFHLNLFGLNAYAQVLHTPGEFLPQRAALARYADGSLAAWTKDGTKPEVKVRNPEWQCYLIENGFSRMESVHTTFVYSTPGYHIATPLPIAVVPTEFPLSFAAKRVDRGGMECSFAAEEGDVTQPVVVHIGNGMYPVTPGSEHRISLVSPSKTQTGTVRAGANGVLTLTLPEANCHVQLLPPELAPPRHETVETVIDAKELPEETPSAPAPETGAPMQ